MQKTKQKGNGEGTIYLNKKTGLHIGQYVYNGKRKSIYQKKNEKITDFKKRFNNTLSSINQGTYIEKSNDTLNKILENYITQKYEDGIISPRSYKRELETLAQIQKTCNNFIDLSIQKVNIEHIEHAKKEIRKYSKSVIEKIWRLLKKGFKIAHSRRKIMFNIMDDETLCRPISAKQQKNIEALTSDEEKKLRKILNNHEKEHKYRNIVMTQLESGMRIGEVLARSLDDINLVQNTIHIWSTLTQDEKYNIIFKEHTKIYDRKTGIDKGERTIPMSQEIRKIVLEITECDLRNIKNLLFWDYDKNTFITPNEINQWLKRLNEKYKITNKSLTSHVLRHSRITRLQESGVHLSVIQYTVGHTKGSKITDEVYTSISEEFAKSELKKVK